MQETTASYQRYQELTEADSDKLAAACGRLLARLPDNRASLELHPCTIVKDGASEYVEQITDADDRRPIAFYTLYLWQEGKGLDSLADYTTWPAAERAAVQLFDEFPQLDRPAWTPLKVDGFKLIPTGGGCTALQMATKNEEREILLTDANDGQAPTGLSETIEATFYHNGEIVGQVQFDRRHLGIIEFTTV